MANGSTRIALAEMQLGKATAENDELKKLDKNLPRKMPLKNPSEHNHSK